MDESKYAHKKVLITGGLGFIGSTLAHKLVALHSDVTLVDSLIPGYGGNLENIEDIEGFDNPTILYGEKAQEVQRFLKKQSRKIHGFTAKDIINELEILLRDNI